MTHFYVGEFVKAQNASAVTGTIRSFFNHVSQFRKVSWITIVVADSRVFSVSCVWFRKASAIPTVVSAFAIGKLCPQNRHAICLTSSIANRNVCNVRRVRWKTRVRTIVDFCVVRLYARTIGGATSKTFLLSVVVIRFLSTIVQLALWLREFSCSCTFVSIIRIDRLVTRSSHALIGSILGITYWRHSPGSLGIRSFQAFYSGSVSFVRSLLLFAHTFFVEPIWRCCCCFMAQQHCRRDRFSLQDHHARIGHHRWLARNARRRVLRCPFRIRRLTLSSSIVDDNFVRFVCRRPHHRLPRFTFWK